MRKQWFAKPWWVAAMNNRTGNPFSGLLARRSLADGHPTEVERIIDKINLVYDKGWVVLGIEA
jgi:hypothetical protein